MGTDNSNENSEKPKPIFWGYWLPVYDYESAKGAARSGAAIGVWMVLSYTVSVGLLYFSGSTPFASPPENLADLYSLYVIGIGSVVLGAWLGYRIYKAKFGAVPFLFIWAMFEIVSKINSNPDLVPAYIISAIIFLIALTSLRGWLGLRKYREEDGQQLERSTSVDE
jgi:hypothetical protein